MKRLIPTLLLPLLLIQAPSFAQSASSTSTNTRPPSQLSNSAPEPTLIAQKGTEQLRLQLVNCQGWLDCAIARLLLPASATINQRELQFDNPTQSPVTVLNTAVVVQGDLTGYQLTNGALALPQTIPPLPANQIVSIPLTINRTQMPPDHYGGNISLALRGRGDRLTVPVNLSVRTGPSFPLLVLFFGIILGRLLKYMQERGEPQANALREVYRLRNDIETSGLEDQNKQLLLGMVPEVEKMVDRQQLDGVLLQIQSIRGRLEILKKLQLLENQINEQADKLPTDADSFTTPIRKVRRLIAEKQDDEAKALLETIAAELDQYELRSAGDTRLESFKRSIQQTVTATTQINQPTTIQTYPIEQPAKFRQLLILLSGITDRVRAEATYWVVRPLLSLTLLIGLSGVGINSLYIENGTSFGARPFSDYLGLILWGLSADVASRSLSSLQGSKE
ncbi:MAG TPA: hypothetical protein V6C46_01610 [Coleofasciculaceae cyanobacterium]